MNSKNLNQFISPENINKSQKTYLDKKSIFHLFIKYNKMQIKEHQNNFIIKKPILNIIQI